MENQRDVATATTLFLFCQQPQKKHKTLGTSLDFGPSGTPVPTIAIAGLLPRVLYTANAHQSFADRRGRRSLQEQYLDRLSKKNYHPIAKFLWSKPSLKVRLLLAKYAKEPKTTFADRRERTLLKIPIKCTQRLVPKKIANTLQSRISSLCDFIHQRGYFIHQHGYFIHDGGFHPSQTDLIVRGITPRSCLQSVQKPHE